SELRRTRERDVRWPVARVSRTGLPTCASRERGDRRDIRHITERAEAATPARSEGDSKRQRETYHGPSGSRAEKDEPCSGCIADSRRSEPLRPPTCWSFSRLAVRSRRAWGSRKAE